MTVSVIIPIYNEEKVIGNCLASLAKQIIKAEIIVVDDGSTDGSAKFATYRQTHQGPGAARNLGASKAKGDILVFVDADMEFEPDFIEKLVVPIVSGIAIGSYSTEEYLLNKDKPLARCWNLNFNRSKEKMDPRGFAIKATGLYGIGKNVLEKIEGCKASENKNRVFRAILKSKFQEAGGFDTKVGYTDDWTISQKLNEFPVAVNDAVYYHCSPESFPEVWRQARWYGKNTFLTKNIIRKLYNFWRYFPLSAIFKGLYGAFRYKESLFLFFKITFDTAVFVSIVLSFFGEQKAR